VTERIAKDIEDKIALRKQGLLDPKAEAYRDHEARPLAEHVAAWGESIAAEGASPKHVEIVTGRVRRIIALVRGARLLDVFPATRRRPADVARARRRLAEWVAPAHLSDLTAERVRKALATLKAEGQSLQTCNHYRNAVRSFSKWCWDTHRLREDPLRGVKGFNAKEDRRHDRRTISLEELRRLIDAAEHGPVVVGMTGSLRALCYRLAVSTGLRYSEISSITTGSFDWMAKSVTVAAAYTKNGDPAALPLPEDLADDIRAYVATLEPGAPVFPLPVDRGAYNLRIDLDAAGLPYRDAAGLVFDFHSLRCETATLADQAGVTPRVVQRLMRHSTLELTGRYTRPRAVDVQAAAAKLPSLKPGGDKPEALAATGTEDGSKIAYPDRAVRAVPIVETHLSRGPVQNTPQADAYACNSHAGQELGSSIQWCAHPPDRAVVPTRDRERVDRRRVVGTVCGRSRRSGLRGLDRAARTDGPGRLPAVAPRSQ
jgi:integrase